MSPRAWYALSFLLVLPVLVVSAVTAASTPLVINGLELVALVSGGWLFYVALWMGRRP